MPTKMKPYQRWWWLGGLLGVAGAALVAGVPIVTLLTVAAVLACPAAMLFGMGMMGRMQEGPAAANAPPAPPRLAETGARIPSPGSSNSEPAGGPDGIAPEGAIDDRDPMTILKCRLAAGAITVEDYERLAAVIAGPGPASAKPTEHR